MNCILGVVMGIVGVEELSVKLELFAYGESPFFYYCRVRSLLRDAGCYCGTKAKYEGQWRTFGKSAPGLMIYIRILTLGNKGQQRMIGRFIYFGSAFWAGSRGAIHREIVGMQ